MPAKQFSIPTYLSWPTQYPPRITNLVGRTFHYLHVIAYAGLKDMGPGRRVHYWLCRCACDSLTIVSGLKLPSGHTKSCGCQQFAPMIAANTTHKMRRTLVYSRWSDMRTRCLNPRYKQRKDYAGRGITICPAWNSFEQFYADMGEPPTPQHQLDRINNDDGYSRDNCRWATVREQRRNMRNNRHIVVDGVDHILVEWAEISGLPARIISLRIKKGMNPKDAISLPRKGNSNVSPS